MKEHLIIHSQFDQLPLDVLILSPSHPIGIVQFSHGMCEHKERYLEFIQELNDAGYVCCIHDHRGHGKSVFNDYDLGYLNKNGHIGIVEDLHQMTLIMKKRYPKLPIYLFGHSMGSLVVRCFIKKYDDDINGLFICGSPSYNQFTNLGIHLTSFFTKIKGSHYRPNIIQKIGFDAFNRKFDSQVENSWICSNKDVVEAYNNNPLCHYIFTNNGFFSLFQLMKETYNHDGWTLKNQTLPIVFIAGEDDPCIINQKSFLQAVQFLKDVGYTHVSYQLFKDMRHEILNETHKDIVYQFILETLKTW